MVKENFYHSKQKAAYLSMLTENGPKRNAQGVITKDAKYQKRKCKAVSRIHPNRKWFTNTKMITQNDIDKLRNTVFNKSVYEVLLSKGKVPYSLLTEEKSKKDKVNYETVFGKKANRKKPKIDVESIIKAAKNKDEITNESVNTTIQDIDSDKFSYVKGQSKRIWNELYKVIDSSDVIIHVLDARDPIGTKCPAVYKYIKENSHKHLIYVLNKVDLVPTGVTAKWLKFLSQETPTVAFHSTSLTNFYGRNNLTNILRQFSNLHKEKKEISVGFVGYPNVGKSSIINVLRNKKVCNVAPVPGETKVWQYISLSGKVYLIDCPGVVPICDEKMAVLRGAVRIENVIDPEFYVNEMCSKAKNALEKVYGFVFEDVDDFLTKVAHRFGRLIKNGEADTSSAAKIVLHDWVKGKIPFFVEAPQIE
ncbi:GTPase required for pre-60S ribosomal subunit nuclear export and maturation [Binucleata daphniae]